MQVLSTAALAALGAATLASSSATAEGLSQARAADLMCDVTQHGARGDNVTKDTAAIRAAIAACEGGGTVLLPAPGRYLTAPFNLTSNQILRIEHGAMLLASTDMIDYAPVTFLPSFTDSGCRYTNIIGAYNQTNITVTGGGVADGQGGGLFWPLLPNGGCDPKAGCPVSPAARSGGKCFNLTGTEPVPAGCLQCLRPHLLEFMHTV
jgi:polygalacturonase